MNRLAKSARYGRNSLHKESREFCLPSREKSAPEQGILERKIKREGTEKLGGAALIRIITILLADSTYYPDCLGYQAQLPGRYVPCRRRAAPYIPYCSTRVVLVVAR
jgi:hypothetical protein